jgi:hypothetical protein
MAKEVAWPASCDQHHRGHLGDGGHIDEAQQRLATENGNGGHRPEGQGGAHAHREGRMVVGGHN